MNVKEYLEKHPKEMLPEVKDWIDFFIQEIGSSRVLEVGSGPGRDADYMESKGVKVQRTDCYPDFVAYQKENGKDIDLLDIVNINPKEGSEKAIFMKLVFHFLSPSQVEKAFNNVHKILKKGGYFAFNVMVGWGKDELNTILKNHGFSIVRITEDQTWFYVVCKK